MIIEKGKLQIAGSSYEPWFASELATIPPLPFRRGEGRGEGSAFTLGFMVPMCGQKTVEANH